MGTDCRQLERSDTPGEAGQSQHLPDAQGPEDGPRSPRPARSSSGGDDLSPIFAIRTGTKRTWSWSRSVIWGSGGRRQDGGGEARSIARWFL